MEDDHKTPSPSFPDRRRTSTMKISCLHNRHSDSHLHSPTLKNSHSTWLKSKFRFNDHATSLDYKPGNGGKHFRHRSSGGTIMNRHRRPSTTEFNYDPLSYALNFEEDGLHAQSFMSRLPVSPPGTNKIDVSTARIEAVEMARTDRGA